MLYKVRSISISLLVAALAGAVGFGDWCLAVIAHHG